LSLFFKSCFLSLFFKSSLAVALGSGQELIA